MKKLKNLKLIVDRFVITKNIINLNEACLNHAQGKLILSFQLGLISYSSYIRAFNITQKIIWKQKILIR